MAVWMFQQNRGSDKWKIHFLLESYYELCLVGRPKKIKILTGKYFFRFFKENLGADIFSFWVYWPLKSSTFPWKHSLIFSSIVLMPIYKVFWTIYRTNIL